MKRFVVFLLAMAVIGVGMASVSHAKKMAGHRYMVMATHTPEQCMNVLDDFETAKALKNFEFGCESGDHTAYAIVTAANEDEAKAMLPEDQRANAKVVKLDRFTAEQLRAVHAKMAAQPAGK